MTVLAASGREDVFFDIRSGEQGITVIPSDATPLLARGRLDRDLFNVSALVEQGYDDRASQYLPLILTYPASVRATKATAMPGLSEARWLSSAHGAAARERKRDAARFWASLKDQTNVNATGDVAKVWLDRKVRASLDQSVPQIGAPEAWASGFTGKDVKVAVLDTGVDRAHPDLTDAIVAEQDFTASESGPADRHGHGTHVASIITGSGSASGGRYQGVAPDAELLNGKVLDDDGSGSWSGVIAGMEWATAHGAKVVNMSVGGDPTDGTDPVSAAVNALTEQTGALFVVASGNEPNCFGGVSAPASADAALAVGAVDKQSQLASFSCTGPRLRDGAVKPDLTAPGVGIVAARAADTTLDEPVDEHYVRANGTSMATPHVAGAAAILAQQHPDWTAGRLKDSLMGAAQPGDYTVYQQGTGRLDVARAVRQSVTASPGSLSTFLKWGDSSVERAITYRNDGDAPITLAVGIATTGPDGNPAPGGMFAVNPTQLTVPPHETAAAAVSIDPAGAAPGSYSAMVTATGDETAIHTAVGAYREPESYDVTVNVIDRVGRQLTDADEPFAAPVLTNLETGELSGVQLTGGEYVVRVPKGRYSLETGIATLAADGETVDSATFGSVPEINVDHDTTATLDARQGRHVTATVDNERAKPTQAILGVMSQVTPDAGQEFYGIDTSTGGTQELYAIPTAKVGSRAYDLLYLQVMADPKPDGHRPGGYQLTFTAHGTIPRELAFQARDRDLAAVDARIFAQGVPSGAAWWASSVYIEGLQHFAPGAIVDVRPPIQVTYLVSPGAAPGRTSKWEFELAGHDENGLLYVEFTNLQPRELRPGEQWRQTWDNAAIGPYMIGIIGGGGLFAGVEAFSPAAAQHRTSVFGGTTGQIELRRNGELVGTSDDPTAGFFELPEGQASFSLTSTAQRDVPWSSLASKVAATWTFTSDVPEESELLPLPNLRIDGSFDAYGRAPTGRPFPLTITAEYIDGSPVLEISEVTLQASFDNGRTWRNIEVHLSSDGFQGVVPKPPPDASTVSLRASARDVNGSRVDQTVMGAYGLAE
ncbi:S8 family serine peptidase [Flindersiella endophytica]